MSKYYDLAWKAYCEYGVRIEPKHSKWYWRALDFLITIFTLGFVHFNNDYHTTIGNRIGVAYSWEWMSDDEKYVILSHELEHVKQFKKAGFGNVWLGTVIAGFAYLFLPLPIGLAYFRMRMERAAFAQTIRATAEVRGYVEACKLYDHIERQFTGPNYLWMWPFKKSTREWFSDVFVRVVKEDREARLRRERDKHAGL